jgi:hypothetical protein
MSAYSPGSEPRRLPECSEARGELLRVLILEGFAVAMFSWGAISLPGEMEPKLTALVGHEIAVLRLDGRYHIREADDA